MNFLPVLPTTITGGPYIPEIELSGEIVAAGSSAPYELRNSDTTGTPVPVVAFQSIPTAVFLGHGVLAEYIRLPGHNVARIDPSVAADMAQASGINGAGSAALKMVRTAGVGAGHSVLVNGASGSVGSVVVQLCKLRGAWVVGVASGGNEGLVRGLGVDEVGIHLYYKKLYKKRMVELTLYTQFIDYQNHTPLPTYLTQNYTTHPFDFILDCVGTQSLYTNSPNYLKPTGAAINIGALEGFGKTAFNVLFNTFLPTWLGGVPRRYSMFSSPPSRDDAVYIARLVEEGKLRIPVDGVFGFEDLVGAYERIGSKRARGKVVVQVCRD